MPDIIIADNEENLREGLGAVLSDFGDVHLAFNANSAFVILGNLVREKISKIVLLADYNFGKNQTTGIQLIKAVRRCNHNNGSSILTILMTGYACVVRDIENDHDLVKLINVRLLKPFKIEEVIGVITAFSRK